MFIILYGISHAVISTYKRQRDELDSGESGDKLTKRNSPNNIVAYMCSLCKFFKEMHLQSNQMFFYKANSAMLWFGVPVIIHSLLLQQLSTLNSNFLEQVVKFPFIIFFEKFWLSFFLYKMQYLTPFWDQSRRK